MSNFQVFEFGELRFTKEELKTLDRNIFLLVVGSSVAANDVAVLQRLAIFHGHRQTDSEVIKTYIGVNSLIIFRLLSAKVYEYVYFIEGYAKRLRRDNNQNLLNFLEKAEEFLDIKNDSEYATAKEIRDNVTHHYRGATDVRNLNTFADNHIFSMFLHQSSGNSLSPLGEDIGTFGILRSRNDGIDAERFIGWNTKASGMITSFQHQSMILILEEFFPEKRLVKRTVPADSMLVGNEDTRSPLLFKRKS
jgi:hypothetical protein